MTNNKITLEFHDKSLEREFKDQNDFSNGIYYRIGCAISVVKWMGFNISVYMLIPEQFFNVMSVTAVLIFPLLFSAHGIFVLRLTAWKSIQRGVRVTNRTLPTTILFFGAAFLLSQGLDILWRIPPSTSWLTLIGGQPKKSSHGSYPGLL